jgi:hypothetical protein
VVEKVGSRASAGETLNDWREAERALENATHAREAAEAAAKTAEIAERSARKTADAAKRSLEAASEAEATARSTAEAAMATSELAHIDLSAKKSRERDAQGAEGEAKAAYHEAEGRARQNGNTR